MSFLLNSKTPLGKMWRVIPVVISGQNANTYWIAKHFYINSGEIILLEMSVEFAKNFANDTYSLLHKVISDQYVRGEIF